MSPTADGALRTLAHPLRSRILAELRVHGQATATELATALDTNTGATSYHLRKLAAVGLVVDSETGTGRRRVWRATALPASAESGSGGVQASWGLVPADDGAEMDEDELEASRWLALDYVEHFGDRNRRWLDYRDSWPEPWSTTCGLTDDAIQVTAEQLTAMHAEVQEVIDRYRRIGQGNPQAKRVVFYTCSLPVDPRTRPSGLC